MVCALGPTLKRNVFAILAPKPPVKKSSSIQSSSTKAPATLAPHVTEYFSYLPIAAAAHVLGDIASKSPYWWYANQVATLVVVTDAITEYSSQERTSPYGTVFQAITADLLYELREFENVMQAVTSFSSTTDYDSDLEHPIDQISGDEQNAALYLFRKTFLMCNNAFKPTMLNCPRTVETSRRLYWYLRECKRVTEELDSNATIVCSCGTSICYRHNIGKAMSDACYSITPDAPPCSRRLEFMAVCIAWFASVLATFFGLALNPDTQTSSKNIMWILQDAQD
ncbi:hypothetical protein BG011_006080 [Mortierella polycephala]|uniref:Uncharacterized protein n=1 Tax=Mortierella polycephala TaxID=41804 RepID=A0A9P6PW00_9FUNG|nr:hypothetical protein BG011_006080 [Mortierella polycephala]